MQIITDVKPTKELEAAIAAELDNKDKQEISIANLIDLAVVEQREANDEPECGPRDL